MKLADYRQLKIRSDLVISAQSHQGQINYVIKDPITLRYFRLRSTEYAIFRMLDGTHSVDDIKAELATLGHDISDDELQLFLRQLGAANFFENVLPNQAESLYQMSTLRRRKKSVWSQAKRILYIKLPLVDPDRFFTKVMPYIDFLWSKWALAAYAGLLGFAFWAFFTNYREAAARFSGLLTAQSLVIFWVIFVVEKFFHELGHGFTCKHFGGDVHEMGVLVLVLTPCMYCNISDAWILEKHSRKFYISAAGIMTELVIAALATVVWWGTGPGIVNSISYRVMLLAGVSSVLINGNPLMKWDGYYILSDALGMPNLRENSVRYVGQFFSKYILGLKVAAAGKFGRENRIKLAYGVLSSAWIIYVMYRITRGMLTRFPAVGIWVLISTVYGLILIPVVRIAKFLRKPSEKTDVNLGRLAIVAGVITAAGYFLFVYNVGYSISAPCVIQPSRSQVLKAPAAGIMAQMSLREGDRVDEQDIIARLENPELELSIRMMQAQVGAYEVQINSARSRGQSTLAANIEKSRAEMEAQIAQGRARIESLTVTAPFAGIIVTPNPQSQVGRFLAEGDTICELVDMERAKVTIAVGESQLQFVKEDAPASVTLRAYPWRAFGGTVAFISRAPLRSLPSAALGSRAGGNVMTRTDTAAHVPITTVYEVNILLPNTNAELLIGMVGKTTIESGSRRIWDIIYVRMRESLRKSFGLVG